MQTTAIIESLAKLRSQFEKPPTDMEIIRRALSSQAARLGAVEMPPILNEGQRKVFLGNLDELTAFLNSEDGADAIELLINTFSGFVKARQEANQPKPPDEPE
jgi:hypothetical protein